MNRAAGERVLRTVHAGLAVALAIVGIASVVPVHPVAERFAEWGFPTWFARVIGAVHLSAAALVAWRRGAAVGAVLAASLALGSVFVRTVNGEIVQAFAPTMLLAAAVVVAWAASDGRALDVSGGED